MRRTAVMDPPSRARLVAALVVAALAAAPGASAMIPPLVFRADQISVDKDGWWNRLAGPQESSLPTLPLPAPPNIPANALAVSATGTDVDKVAAIGILLDGPVARLALTLKESESPAASIGAQAAVVVACPATSFWGVVRNGNWVDRPSWDCDAAKAEGVRADDGSWTFDLTPIAALWQAETPLDPNGVVLLLDTTETPQTAQVAFQDRTTGAIGLASIPGPARTVARETTRPAPEPPAPAPVPAAVPVTMGDLVTPSVATDDPPPAILTTAPALARPEPIGEPNVLGNWPLAVFVLTPVLLVLLGLTSYVLGPAGEPEGPRRREGSISRALSKSEDPSV